MIDDRIYRIYRIVHRGDGIHKLHITKHENITLCGTPCNHYFLYRFPLKLRNDDDWRNIDYQKQCGRCNNLWSNECLSWARAIDRACYLRTQAGEILTFCYACGLVIENNEERFTVPNRDEREKTELVCKPCYKYWGYDEAIA